MIRCSIPYSRSNRNRRIQILSLVLIAGCGALIAQQLFAAGKSKAKQVDEVTDAYGNPVDLSADANSLKGGADDDFAVISKKIEKDRKQKGSKDSFDEGSEKELEQLKQERLKREGAQTAADQQNANRYRQEKLQAMRDLEKDGNKYRKSVRNEVPSIEDEDAYWPGLDGETK